jgi:hypothetical protein
MYIMISKRRSCLKGDIVEAPQCIKCAIRHDLLFQEPAPSLGLEAEESSDQELENVEDGGKLETGRTVRSCHGMICLLKMKMRTPCIVLISFVHGCSVQTKNRFLPMKAVA